MQQARRQQGGSDPGLGMMPPNQVTGCGQKPVPVLFLFFISFPSSLGFCACGTPGVYVPASGRRPSSFLGGYTGDYTG